MKFNESLARLLREELRGATVASVDESAYLSGGCKVTFILCDGREASMIAAAYWSEVKLSKDSRTDGETK